LVVEKFNDSQYRNNIDAMVPDFNFGIGDPMGLGIDRKISIGNPMGLGTDGKIYRIGVGIGTRSFKLSRIVIDCHRSPNNLGLPTVF